MCGSDTSYLVEGDGALASSLHFSRAPSLRDGLHIVPVAGGLRPLAWREEVGSDPLRVRLRGLRPPTTSVLSTAGLWQWSILRCRGVVTRCWCDGGGGYPPSSGGGVYGGSTPSGDCPALCGGFRSGDLLSAIRWLATVCADPCWGVSTFSPLERAPLHWNIRGLRPASARQKEVPRLWLCNNGQCVA
jgi:hypothetical protein